MNEVYNLERATALEKRIDPTGKRWTIKGDRESALVHARPDPDRVDAQIPQVFQGRWTSPAVLKEKIDVWLNREWDKSDAAANRSRLKAHKLLNDVEEANKITPEESLDALSEEIKQELGLTDANTNQDATPSEVPKEEVTKAGKGGSTKANKNPKPTGRKKAKQS